MARRPVTLTTERRPNMERNRQSQIKLNVFCSYDLKNESSGVGSAISK
jgi:hypothetical protein